MNRRQIRTVPATAADARQFLAKALEYLATATSCLDAGHWTAATGNAIHAGINAADALCARHRGVRATGTDHAVSGDLLIGIPDGNRPAEAYRRLVANKARAEYEPAPVSRALAQRCVRWATVLVDAAQAAFEQD